MKLINKIAISLLTIIFCSLIGIKSSNAQLELYQLSKEFLYPDIYIPNRILKVDNFQELEIDLKNNNNNVNAYIVDANDKNTNTTLKSFERQKIPASAYTKLSNEKYLFKLSKDTSDLSLIFNQTFHGAWEIKYLGAKDFSCDQKEELAKFNATKCINSEMTIIQDMLFSITNRGTNLESAHYIANGMVNAWDIKDAKAGTYLITFRVHNYFLIGLIITIISALIPSIYLMYDFISKLHKNVTRFFIK